jgi:class 3 adenylate cyclase
VADTWLTYRWEWMLPAPREALWPLVSNTNRFNRDAGVPAVERDGPRRLEFRRYGVRVEWDEEPFEWVRPERFGVVRRYRHGPLREMKVRVALDDEGGATRLHYDVDVLPRGATGRLAVPIEIGVFARRRFGKVFASYARAAAAMAEPPPSQATLAPGGQARLARARDDLAAVSTPHLAERLTDTLEHGDELDLAQLRPFARADRWDEPRRDVLELCLHGVRSGVLEFRWSVMCPQCRGPSQQEAALADLRPGDAHCDSCGIVFGPDFDQAVELRFRPSPAVRAVTVGEFCIGGPQVTPHIVLQQRLDPGESRTVTVPLEPGRYQLRSASGTKFVVATAGGPSAPDAEGAVGLDATLELTNSGDAPDVQVLERVAWTDQAVTAAEVTSLQVFRDLFATEALRPGEQISVGGIAVLFTDLRDSTRFYRDVGDAPAFGAVMSHFDVLRAAIAAEEGATIKTMGDAVMAVFHRPASALRAIDRARHDLADPLVLKAGLHAGPCIAVTQNERLDYFGSTVNVAARLVGLSKGGDIVVSDEVLRDPEVADAVQGRAAEPVDALLKGFEDTPFRVWRLT